MTKTNSEKSDPVRDLAEESEIRSFAACTLFPKLKFLDDDHMDMVHGKGSLCAYVATHFGQPTSAWAEWWKTKKYDVKKGLEHHRAYVTGKIKREFYGMTDLLYFAHLFCQT